MSRVFTGTAWRIANALAAFINITPCSMAITKSIGSSATRRWPRDRESHFWSNLES